MITGECLTMPDYEIRLPRFAGRPELPEEIDEYWEIMAWRVSEGEDVKQGQDFLHIETDDLEIHLTAPVTGHLKKFVARVGEKVREGDVLAIFDIDLSENE